LFYQECGCGICADIHKSIKIIFFFCIRAARNIQWNPTLIGRDENVSLNMKISIFSENKKSHFVRLISSPPTLIKRFKDSKYFFKNTHVCA